MLERATFSFDKDVANDVGVSAAIVLRYLSDWIYFNEKRGQNFYDGKYWTSITIKSMCDEFSFFSRRTIIDVLGKLKTAGYLEVRCFNKNPQNRTNWYTLTDKALGQIRTISDRRTSDNSANSTPVHSANSAPVHSANSAPVHSANSAPCIKNNKTKEENKNNNISSISSELEREFESLWKLYPNKQGKKKSLAEYVRARRKGTSYEEVKDGIERYLEYIRTEKIEPQFVKHGDTFFRNACWEDEFQTKRKSDDYLPYLE